MSGEHRMPGAVGTMENPEAFPMLEGASAMLRTAIQRLYADLEDNESSAPVHEGIAIMIGLCLGARQSVEQVLDKSGYVRQLRVNAQVKFAVMPGAKDGKDSKDGKDGSAGS